MSKVCPHERNCAGHCVLGNKATPVEFYRLEEYVSRFFLETYSIPKIEKNGIKIAVPVTGPKTVVEAVAFTKKVFARMDEYLKQDK